VRRCPKESQVGSNIVGCRTGIWIEPPGQTSSKVLAYVVAPTAAFSLACGGWPDKAAYRVPFTEH
jgi:hypothetical protein